MNNVDERINRILANKEGGPDLVQQGSEPLRRPSAGRGVNVTSGTDHVAENARIAAEREAARQPHAATQIATPDSSKLSAEFVEIGSVRIYPSTVVGFEKTFSRASDYDVTLDGALLKGEDAKLKAIYDALAEQSKKGKK